MSIEGIEAAARQFRAAIEQTPSNIRPFTFKKFPLGCCGDSSLLLATHLSQLGLGDFDYVCGKQDDGKTHAWLEQGEMIVDITADQFEGAPQGVIFSTNSPFHRQFKEQGNQRWRAGLEVSDGEYIAELWRFYHRLTVKD